MFSHILFDSGVISREGDFLLQNRIVEVNRLLFEIFGFPLIP